MANTELNEKGQLITGSHEHALDILGIISKGGEYGAEGEVITPPVKLLGRNVCTYTWQPQEDITTYELALCMPLMVVGTTPDGWMQMDWMYDHLPAKARRHWSVENKAEARL